jgi:hypothetical protein
VSDLSPGKPELEVLGDVMYISWPAGITAEVERFSESRGDLTAEVTLRTSRPPRQGLLHSARLNIMSTTARAAVAKALRQRITDLDWEALLESLCFLVRGRYREGEPSIDLREYEPVRALRPFVRPFVEHGGPTVLAAHGGSGKTRCAWAIAVTASTGVPVLGELSGEPCPVLFADYETDADTGEEIRASICASAGIVEKPAIHYRRMVASLPESAATLHREVVRTQAGLVVIDSLGPARGGDPNDAETTIRTFNAARALGVPVLFTDHVTNAEALSGDPKKPFGSAYTWNLARVVWMMEKVQDENDNAITVAFVNKKRNNGRMLSRLGFRISFENGSDDQLLGIRFARQDLSNVPGLAEKLPVRTRIVGLLGRRRQMKIHEIAEELGIPADTVKKTVDRNDKLFWKGPGPDGVHRIALLAREAAQ